MALKPLKTLNFGGEDTYYLDFKNVENMPFETVGGDTLVWDGETDGLTVVAGAFYKVSDAVPTVDDFSDGAIICLNGSYEEIPADGLEIYSDNIFLVGPIYIVSSAPADLEELTFPETGIYFMHTPGNMVVSSLTINGYTGFETVTLKEECVPVDYITEKVLSALPTWSGGEY